MELSELTYPEMRGELISHLRSLADPEYQVRVWVRGELAEGIQHDELDYVIHFIYDDTPLASNAASCVGWFLIDQREVAALENLVRKLDALFDEHGLNLTDAEYISKPQWGKVVESAADALAIFDRR